LILNRLLKSLHRRGCPNRAQKGPASESATWQLLQLLSATTVRRGVTGEPSTEKFTTGFGAPSVTVCYEVAPGNTVTVMRASPPMVYVPVALAGMALVNVYVQAPPESHVAFRELSVT
jgi:hypothetical protein